jgi:hypothetical protein
LATTPNDIEGVTIDANDGVRRPTEFDVINPVNGLIGDTVVEAPAYGESTKHRAAEVNTPRPAGPGAMESYTAEFGALNAALPIHPLRQGRPLDGLEVNRDEVLDLIHGRMCGRLCHCRTWSNGGVVAKPSTPTNRGSERE